MSPRERAASNRPRRARFGARADTSTRRGARFGAPAAASALVVALGILTLAGCGGGHAPRRTPTPGSPAERTPEPPSDAQLIDDVIRDRGEALAAGDTRAYVATGTRARRRVERVAAARAAMLPLRTLELDPGAIDVTGRRARVRVMVRYGFDGIRGTFQSTHRMELVKVGESWRVAAVRAARGRPPWEVDAFRVRRTRHFMILAPRDKVRGLPATLESGYAAIRTRLRRGRLRSRYLVIAAANPAQVRALTTRIRGLETLAAISDATINERGPARAVSAVVSLRLLVVASTFEALAPEGRGRTIAHELTHAALAGSTSGRTPAWLVEGVAMYVSGDRRPAASGDLAALSLPDAIARLSGNAQARAYADSSAAAFAIVDRFGAARLLALYDAFNDDDLRGAPGRRLADRAVRRELGIGLADLP